jgi:hypothetical protein
VRRLLTARMLAPRSWLTTWQNRAVPLLSYSIHLCGIYDGNVLNVYYSALQGDH